jgi:hypothetical protein
MPLITRKKVKVTPNRKSKNKYRNLVKIAENEEVDLEEQNGKLMFMVWLLYRQQNIFELLMLILPYFLNDIRWSGGTL